MMCFVLQLVDFLDVIDDPILGYTAPAVITVLHTHLATCAVDYRYAPKIMAKTFPYEVYLYLYYASEDFTSL